MKSSLKGRSGSQRSGIWWSCSFEKISASEITGCHLGNLVSLTGHCDFFLDHCDFIHHLQGQHNEEPSYQSDPMWALSDSDPSIDLCLSFERPWAYILYYKLRISQQLQKLVRTISYKHIIKEGCNNHFKIIQL